LCENFTIMLIRFVVKNLFSFNEATEFNMLPGKATRLKHHKYKLNDEIEVLKLAAIYGANASGKSNFVNAVEILRDIVLDDRIPSDITSKKFKLIDYNLNLPVEFSIEFSILDKIFFYSISINKGIILEEYLSQIIFGKDEKLLFSRTLDTQNKYKISFYDAFEKEEENRLLSNIIENNLLKSNQSLIFLLTSINNNGSFDFSKEVYMWFSRGLVIIHPDSAPLELPVQLDINKDINDFINESLKSFSTGVTKIINEVKDIKKFFGSDDETEMNSIVEDLKNEPLKVISKRINDEVVNFVIENNKVVSKRLLFEHKKNNGEVVLFKYNELSDGTKRLIDLLPVLNYAINFYPTYIVDEIERSIHPILIKELISKFSKEENTKGQLIFTSHESNLLDQDILRTDEIWFAEKNNRGETKLYSLSDFKEHSTIDIRKGYLQGRYGGIPFISNLQDLNWHKEDVAEK
jgi:AAA15 family ATPase/GTPase